ncbi:hypothetical protein L228DRAFT_236249 [Xylona heveae TC161]|uniref:Uncharacterized protein n=1 Tax=Xylona heveae (strain CBS 132557 / TC161) TaxID=1328760 RepID=A0A165IMV7_XYLHT|nr:hypothetical protein L228DRAFT_236249 [Xylona heveae TC161]KZF25125.1 hypothetical protein L228DRAFT_236249 [Xylona heveae TC161]
MPYRQHHYYRAPSAHETLTLHNLPLTATLTSNGEDELAAEADEPPDEPLHFGRLAAWNPHDAHFVAHCAYVKSIPSQQADRRESLLTRALLTSPDNVADEAHLPSVSHFSRASRTASTWSNASAASTADLTSDGGLTSPTRTNSPSPPQPPSHLHRVGSPKAALLNKLHAGADPNHPRLLPSTTDTSEHESAVEAGLGRKRCITFACGRKSPASDSQSQAGVKSDAGNTSKDSKLAQQPQPQPQPQPRRCMIKFVCNSRSDSPQTNTPSPAHQPSPDLGARESMTESLQPPQSPSSRSHRDSDSTVRNESTGSAIQIPSPLQKPSTRSDPGPEKPEGSRFHEFASSFDEEDDWVNESTVHKERLTVNDTLKKENAIRKMGEEVEQEAEDEANDEDEDEEDAADEDEVSDFSSSSEDEDEDEDEDVVSEGGNETDNEEGFAESDEESDAASDYQFWTPTVKNVSSTAHIEMIRPSPRRSASESSLESHQSPRQTAEMKAQLAEKTKDLAKARRRSRAIARQDTPELPDSTDFVCGTFDEDRPLEAAYVSCLEERKRAKYAPVPQDIDPSFPLSDPDDEDDDESEEEVVDRGRRGSRGRNSPKGQGVVAKKVSPRDSPKRLRSPPPPPRRNVCRSPPPARNLFAHSPRRLRSPPPARHLRSPPATRTVSPGPRVRTPDGCPAFGGHQLTRTKSLPRTPNPFRYYDRELQAAIAEPLSPPGTELRARRAIDIVKGLEKKRQRRKQKFWQKHYRHAGKEKEKKPQPGKGLERMRELGLEMAGKGKGAWFGHNNPQYMLSI